MIIVSQDETVIVKFDNVNAIAIDNENTERQIHARCNNDDDVILGEYVTKERTMEVFQQIIELYGCYNVIASNQGMKGIYQTPQIYKMPKE